MSRTILRRALIALAAPLLTLSVLVVASPVASAATTTVNASGQGWYQYDGSHTASNTNYFVGFNGADWFRDFFVFDVPSVSGSIDSAALVLPNPQVFGSGVGTLTMYEVTISLANLLATHAASDTLGMAAFNDLGGGTVYGSLVVTNAATDPVVVPLNSAGIAAVAAHATSGEPLIFGGDYAGSGTHTLFSGTASSTPRLVLNNTAPVANDLSATVPKGKVTTIPLDGYVSDPDGDALTSIAIASQPASGTGTCGASIDPLGIVYTAPDHRWTGETTCTYTVTDALGASSNEATVTITVGSTKDSTGGDKSGGKPGLVTDVTVDVSTSGISGEVTLNPYRGASTVNVYVGLNGAPVVKQGNSINTTTYYTTATSGGYSEAGVTSVEYSVDASAITGSGDLYVQVVVVSSENSHLLSFSDPLGPYEWPAS